MAAPDAFSVEETRRVARLARIALSPDEEARLAHELHAIAASFAELTAYAAALPATAADEEGALRADEVASASPAEVEAILAAAPRVDARTRLVRVPRGGPP